MTHWNENIQFNNTGTTKCHILMWFGTETQNAFDNSKHKNPWYFGAKSDTILAVDSVFSDSLILAWSDTSKQSWIRCQHCIWDQCTEIAF